MTTTTRKPKIERKKVIVSRWSNNCGYTVTDTNRSSRGYAEVLLTAKGRCNCRIDRNGKPWKYAANIPMDNPEAAYEYTLLCGEMYDENGDLEVDRRYH
jgi:hypothetical protein